MGVLDLMFNEAVEEDQEEATDDVKGGPLDPQLVKEARRAELRYLWERSVYRYASRKEMESVGGRAIRLKWIDTNKGDALHPAVRARLVAMEVRRKGTEAIFSATPPLEALRAVIALTARENPAGRSDPVKLYTADISRAHFYADAVRRVFVELPREDPKSADKGTVGLLQKTMYSTLDAAEQWGFHYAQRLKGAGFVQGAASPCCFYHRGHDIAVVVHGDDFVAAARGAGRDSEPALRGVWAARCRRCDFGGSGRTGRRWGRRSPRRAQWRLQLRRG